MKTASIAAAAAAFLTTMVEAQAFTLKLRSTTPGLPGNSTTATCPSWNANCPGKDVTIFSGPTVDGQPTQMWMGILQEHGQRVYTHAHPDALFQGHYGDLISYTAAGNDESANVPKVDEYGDLFAIKTWDNDDGLLGLKRGERVLAHGSGSSVVFDLCSPQFGNHPGPNTLILSTISKWCTPAALVVEETDVAAPQFYNCDGCELRGANLTNGPSCGAPFCGTNNYFWWN
ncbi:unnamed protein product [Aureobasidium vineae]|uniref:Uncharacterized protein n=1 Tax=Aureobasidium vineae TaxID=2773715 RepID=A0A9N8PDV5_9PEZI|nr:unnamed protein product [Aureobasidium vineae]